MLVTTKLKIRTILNDIRTHYMKVSGTNVTSAGKSSQHKIMSMYTKINPFEAKVFL